MELNFWAHLIPMKFALTKTEISHRPNGQKEEAAAEWPPSDNSTAISTLAPQPGTKNKDGRM